MNKFNKVFTEAVKETVQESELDKLLAEYTRLIVAANLHKYSPSYADGGVRPAFGKAKEAKLALLKHIEDLCEKKYEQGRDDAEFSLKP